MKAFSKLYMALDETTKTNEKINHLVSYLEQANPADSVWAIYFLIGRKPKRLVKTSLLRRWASEVSKIPAWLFEECYDTVGDLAETIALVLPENGESATLHLSEVIEKILIPLKDMEDEKRKEVIIDIWDRFDSHQCFLFNKLLTGGFRVGVSQKLITRALEKVSGVEANVIAHRLMGNWTPSIEFYEQLLSKETIDSDHSKPYPFFLAHPIDSEPEVLGDDESWSAEWKWDGIRAQLIRRKEETFIWSRGEELITHQFPELDDASQSMPGGCVLDGEIICYKDDQVLPFSELQRRLGRKKVGKKLLTEAPVIMMVYDLLELEGVDIREKPLIERLEALETIIGEINSKNFITSEKIEFQNWQELRDFREKSRENKVEGLMLKRKSSPYRVGRQKGDWWKWKVDPLTIDAVLVYAQRGHGRRASLYSDYTFAVWDGDSLVPFAKAYSGLTNEEIRQVDSFVKSNTKERFGPVRSVKPELVFELAFEGIQKSTRHKSGVAVRFPRIKRWRQDKDIKEADTLASVISLLD